MSLVRTCSLLALRIYSRVWARGRCLHTYAYHPRSMDVMISFALLPSSGKYLIPVVSCTQASETRRSEPLFGYKRGGILAVFFLSHGPMIWTCESPASHPSSLDYSFPGWAPSCCACVPICHELDTRNVVASRPPLVRRSWSGIVVFFFSVVGWWCFRYFVRRRLILIFYFLKKIYHFSWRFILAIPSLAPPAGYGLGMHASYW